MVRPRAVGQPSPQANHILQPAFQAINLEPEENVDEQIDTTKELHVSYFVSSSLGHLILTRLPGG